MRRNQNLSKEQLIERVIELEKDFKRLSADYVIVCRANKVYKEQINYLLSKLGAREKNEFELEKMLKGQL